MCAWRRGRRVRGSASGLARVLIDVLLYGLAHVTARFVCTFLPGEHAGGHDPIEAYGGERGEEHIPVDLALPNVQVLVDRHPRPRWVADVAQARRGLVVVEECQR